jgi:hypothetical protein
VSRLKSPQAAAKQAQRAALEAGQRHREKRNSWLMIIGLALVSISLVIADYFWLKAQARQRREVHLQRRHQRIQTNSPTAPVLIPESQNAGALTNHE